MKTIKVTSSGIDADLAAGYLRANGIQAIVQGNKEYASIITGADLGHYKIVVPEDESERAIELLELLQSSPVPSEADMAGRIAKVGAPTEDGAHGKSRPPLGAFSLLKRSVMFAVMGALILPIAFHFGSIYYLHQLVRSTDKSVSRVFWVPVVVTLNIIGLFVWYKLYLT